MYFLEVLLVAKVVKRLNYKETSRLVIAANLNMTICSPSDVALGSVCVSITNGNFTSRGFYQRESKPKKRETRGRNETETDLYLVLGQCNSLLCCGFTVMKTELHVQTGSER